MQKVNKFLPKTKPKKTVKYIDKWNVGLDMLNWSKIHLNRFGMIQLVKNYRKIIKAWHQKEKLVNENVPILKAVGSSSSCGTVKKWKISDNQQKAIQENPIDFTRKFWQAASPSFSYFFFPQNSQSATKISKNQLVNDLTRGWQSMNLSPWRPQNFQQ